MHSRTPPGAAAAGEPGDQFSAELASVLASARRRAVRDGDRQIDTAHLLHGLLEYDPEVCALFEAHPRAGRLRGYLVQRSIGYGLRWQGAVEDSDAVPAGPAAGVPDCSPAARAAMHRAVHRSRGRGVARAAGVDLLAALAADAGCRAAEVLRRVGIDPGQLAHALSDRCYRGDTPVGA